MKKTIIRIILIGLILLWMVAVFSFSSDNAETSSGLSFKISRFFVHTDEDAEIIQPYIRKIAHLLEYAAGGFLFYGFFLTVSLDSKKQVIFAGIAGILYAVLDEIHQRFVPRKSRANSGCGNRFFRCDFRNLCVIVFGKINQSISKEMKGC